LSKKLRQKEAAQAPKMEAAPVLNADNEPPMFSFRYLQKGYCISDCTKDEKAALATKLREMSSLTWYQLKTAPRHGMGKENISRSSIRAGIPRHVTEDTVFWAFRFAGKAPMVGYHSRGVFYVLWLDRVFTLYPH